MPDQPQKIPLPVSCKLMRERLDRSYYIGPKSFIEDVYTLFANGLTTKVITEGDHTCMLQQLGGDIGNMLFGGVI